MEKLEIAPDFEGYGLADTASPLYQPLDGGRGRQRGDIIDGTQVVTCQWTVGRKRYEVLRDFYAAYMGRDAEKFLIDLYNSESELVEHEANFIDFALTGHNGLTYSIRARLEVQPTTADSAEWVTPDETTATLTLQPDQTGYSLQFGRDQVSVIGEGASGHYARNLFNNAKFASCKWICDGDEYEYLKAFHRARTIAGGSIFNAALLFDDVDALTTYQCQFVPNTFKLSSVSGETFFVDAVLEIKPLDYDVEANPFVVDSGIADTRLRSGAGVFTITGGTLQIKVPFTDFALAAGSFTITGGDSTAIYAKYSFQLGSGEFEINGGDIEVVPDNVELRSGDGGYGLRSDGYYEIRSGS